MLSPRLGKDSESATARRKHGPRRSRPLPRALEEISAGWHAFAATWQGQRICNSTAKAWAPKKPTATTCAGRNKRRVACFRRDLARTANLQQHGESMGPEE